METDKITIKYKPLVLVILDGWGYSKNQDFNAILSANTPTWDHLWQDYPHTLIQGSGQDVGLPLNQMGNSEVGHINLGAGRVVHQELTRIDQAIEGGSFSENETLIHAIKLAVSNNSSVHILGLLSDGGIHSHEEQIQAMVQMAADKGAPDIYLHAFLDGRDTAPKSAREFIERMEKTFSAIGKGSFASIIGRYFAMDRDRRWPRIKVAYDLITQGKAEYQSPNALAGLEQAYARGETDEFVQATAITEKGNTPVCVEEGDVVIFMNFRADRARHLTEAFIAHDFDFFEREERIKLGAFVCLTEYKKDFNALVAFPHQRVENVFGEYISKLGLRQLRIAETEKYAHVTFFFNGGEEQPFPGEERTLIPSPNVSTYDLQPEMNAPALTDKLIEAIESNQFDVIICNYANPDMVGHSGQFDAVVKAIEAIDRCLERLVDSIQKAGGELLITADHGNAEQMINPETRQPHTAHTSNPVPFIYIGRPASIASGGALSDVAPTMLYLMDIGIPTEMSGHSLVTLNDQ